MITKAQAKIGLLVKWVSLDRTIAPSFGTLTAIGPAPGLDENEIFIVYYDGETGTTYLDSGASRVFSA